jgi:hypothetical protein
VRRTPAGDTARASPRSTRGDEIAEHRHEDQVTRSAAVRLIRDRNVAAACVLDVWKVDPESLPWLRATLFAIGDGRDDVREIRRSLEEDDGETEEDDR